ncbi:LysM domain-containing protein [Bacillus sp. 165]|uniref:LysM peptidoglycan-binding domain-containing protein n=1 Tax=Bacillus sp. 165 TaxID=1529117 RepID=UPI001ADAE54F|nr:LysM domain-containing protein [Bacillus sp. 165]MBO9129623.1 LysM peptidoglycan-binding domain-containing protein [Bacillus sp. 165]
MKRLAITMIALLIGYALFYDITVGTLPLLHTYSSQKQTTTKSVANETISKLYKNLEVKSGDTVLSVVEQINEKGIPSIEKVVTDFRKLNPNSSPNKLRVGQTYKFPLYK